MSSDLVFCIQCRNFLHPQERKGVHEPETHKTQDLKSFSKKYQQMKANIEQYAQRSLEILQNDLQRLLTLKLKTDYTQIVNSYVKYFRFEETELEFDFNTFMREKMKMKPQEVANENPFVNIDSDSEPEDDKNDKNEEKRPFGSLGNIQSQLNKMESQQFNRDRVQHVQIMQKKEENQVQQEMEIEQKRSGCQSPQNPQVNIEISDDSSPLEIVNSPDKLESQSINEKNEQIKGQNQEKSSNSTQKKGVLGFKSCGEADDRPTTVDDDRYYFSDSSLSCNLQSYHSSYFQQENLGEKRINVPSNQKIVGDKRPKGIEREQKTSRKQYKIGNMKYTEDEIIQEWSLMQKWSGRLTKAQKEKKEQISNTIKKEKTLWKQVEKLRKLQ